MKIEINIDLDEIERMVTEKVAEELTELFVSNRRNYDNGLYHRTIQQATRDIIYKDKANLCDRVVAQASREVRNKAVKKLIESIGESDE